MSEMKEYNPGTFCWVELATTDAGAAKKFYTELFGWTYNDNPVGEDMVYSMTQKNGKDAAALYQLTKEMRSQGLPASWLSYVAVASVDDATAKAKTLGANVMKEPFDVFTAGRMAVLQDPTGAVFALWQANEHKGASIVNDAGAFTWNELTTNDVDKAGKFYTELFGWSANTDKGGYTSFTNGERPAGGMMAITKEMGEIPSNWLVYFATDDCDKTAEKAKSLGAHLAVAPCDIPEVGRFAVALDPQHAAFAFIKLNNPA